jgi:exodeoxyribonuclease V gamma subunit
VLHVHRSQRADRLAHALAELLSEPPDDPFTPDIVAVPAKGVERWLAQRLSHVLGASSGAALGGASSAGAAEAGVCAHVLFPPPSALIGEVLSAVTGLSADEDPWRPDRSPWPLLEVIDDCATEPWCEVLGRHLARDSGRRLATAQHLATLFAGYAAARPAMITAWAAGEDSDGTGHTLPPDLSWQPELWRRLRARLAVPSPPERLAAACTLLREDPERVDLPGRVSFFGPTRLTAEQLTVLRALAGHRDVHLWFPHASPVLWDRLGDSLADAPVDKTGLIRRSDDPTRRMPRHPLLASLARDVRELEILLRANGVETPQLTDEHHTAPDPPATLLGRLQQQLRDDAPPTAPVPVPASDRSIQVHACHGRSRQVEVLRDVLLGLLAADLTLEPRDIVVLCPDIDGFAPLISAAFGLPDAEGEHPGHLLRVRLADRSLRETNPLLGTLAALLDLAGGRVTASHVLDLAATAPVRRRFRFDDDELERLEDWVRTSGVRWGLDRVHREPYGLGQIGQNTWVAGLDRVLLGAALADEQHWLGLALPLDDVDSSDLDLAGRLTEYVERLADILDRLTGEHPASDWLATLDAALDLLTEPAPADSWQLTAARRLLGAVGRAAGEHDPLLTLGDIRALLAGRLQGVPTRAGFRTGNLTMCTMVPMRSVPHRVVCLLGMDDGVFPRAAGSDGDDVLLRDPCIGERDPRGEDRQLLLDAVTAAGETLVLLYSGAHERTNAVQPPAVPLGEILDALDRTATTADGQPVREQVVVRHPLQPFDSRNFIRGRLGTDGPFSHDKAALAGALAATGPRQPAPAFLSETLPPATGTADIEDADIPDDVDLESLIRFLEHPARHFVRQRLGIVVAEEADEPADGLTVELRGLDQWQVGERMLTGRLAGLPIEVCQHAEWRRGLLPPGPLGLRSLERLGKDIDPLVAAATPFLEHATDAYDISIDLPDGRVLTGTVGDVRATGPDAGTLLRTTYSRLGPKQRIRAWVLMLALTAAQPDRTWSAVTLGRGPRGSTRPRRAAVGGVAAADAVQILSQLIDLRDRGLRRPLPLPVTTGCAYANARHGGDDPAEAMAKATSEWSSSYENTDRDHALVWGETAAFSVLTEAPWPDENWYEDEPDRFGRLACRLWFPVLDVETVDIP